MRAIGDPYSDCKRPTWGARSHSKTAILRTVTPKILTIRDLLTSQIAALGGDGLCFPALECGCGIDNLMPCKFVDVDGCKVAKRREDGLYYVMEEK